MASKYLITSSGQLDNEGSVQILKINRVAIIIMNDFEWN